VELTALLKTPLLVGRGLVDPPQEPYPLLFFDDNSHTAPRSSRQQVAAAGCLLCCNPDSPVVITTASANQFQVLSGAARYGTPNERSVHAAARPG